MCAVKTVYHVTYVCRARGVPVLAVWVESAFLFPDLNLERNLVSCSTGTVLMFSYISIYNRMFGFGGGHRHRPAAAPGRAKAEAQPQAEA